MLRLIKSMVAPVALLIGMQLTGSANALTEVARVPMAFLGTSQCDTLTATCRAFFPQVAANRRFEIEHVSCSSTSHGELDVVRLAVDNAANTNIANHVLLWTMSTFAGKPIYSLSEPVSFAIPGGKRPQIAALYNIHAPLSFQCTLSGDLVFLQ